MKVEIDIDDLAWLLAVADSDGFDQVGRSRYDRLTVSLVAEQDAMPLAYVPPTVKVVPLKIGGGFSFTDEEYAKLMNYGGLLGSASDKVGNLAKSFTKGGVDSKVFDNGTYLTALDSYHLSPSLPTISVAQLQALLKCTNYKYGINAAIKHLKNVGVNVTTLHPAIEPLTAKMTDTVCKLLGAETKVTKISLKTLQALLPDASGMQLLKAVNDLKEKGIEFSWTAEPPPLGPEAMSKLMQDLYEVKVTYTKKHIEVVLSTTDPVVIKLAIVKLKLLGVEVVQDWQMPQITYDSMKALAKLLGVPSFEEQGVDQWHKMPQEELSAKLTGLLPEKDPGYPTAAIVKKIEDDMMDGSLTIPEFEEWQALPPSEAPAEAAQKKFGTAYGSKKKKGNY